MQWKRKLLQWLHSLFSEYLPKFYLAAWLDILQTLRSKVPVLVDRMLGVHPTATDHPAADKLHQHYSTVIADGLATLVNRPWDPAVSSLSRKRLDKLPGNPVIIVAPPGRVIYFVRIRF